MQLPRHLLGWLVCLPFVLPAPAQAETPPDPLRLVPPQAQFFVRIDQPRKLLDAVLGLEPVREVQQLEGIRELLDSTNARRFFQFLTYYERELGADRRELLDRLAGGGIVLAGQYGNKTPVVLILQGRNESYLHKFLQLARTVIESELTLQESKERLEQGSYEGVATWRIGKDVHAAVLGSALVVGFNTDKGLRAVIDLHRAGGKGLLEVAGVAEARKLLPADPLAWAWFSLEPAHKSSNAAETFKLPRNETLTTILLGGQLDVAGRAPYLCAGVYREPDGFRATVRMPRGRDGLPAALATHVPPAGQPGSRPLLEPQGVLYSSSYYLALGQFWEQRAGLFNEKQVKIFEEANQKTAPFLAGSRMSDLFQQTAPYHRLVAANQEKLGYKTVPAARVPAFALVVELREPEKFSRAMEGVLRSIGLLVTTQVRLKLTEEKHGDCKIVGYRFDEETPLRGDTSNVRFNFSPCFVTVGNQFVASSTLELARELIDLLRKEAPTREARSSPAAAQTQVYAAGGAAFLATVEDQIFAQIFLDSAFAPDVARRQVEALLGILRRLGVLRFETGYGAQDFYYDIAWKQGK